MASPVQGPPDGGWGWMCVIGKLYCYFCVLGTQSAFGIIYIELIDYFDATREEAAWIGSLVSGVTYLVGPLSSSLTRRFGIQKTTAAGTLIAFSGCFVSWFATGLPYLYVSYGVVMAIGFGLILVPCMVIVVQYFKQRSGIANAISSTGNGIGALVLPPLYTYLIGEYGWRGTLLLVSGIILNCLVCAVIFLPPQYLQASSNKGSKTTNTKSISCRAYFSVFNNPCVILYTTGTGIVFLGFIVPFVHLPDLVVLMGMEKYQAAYLVSIIGISNVIGRVVFGFISDLQCTNVICLQSVALMLCGISTSVCPHLTDFYTLAVYCAIYGCFIGVFIGLMPVGLVILVGVSRTGDVLGVLLFFCGIMGAGSSPLAGWIYDTTKSYTIAFYVAASAFLVAGSMILLVVILHHRQVTYKSDKSESVEIAVIQVTKL